MIRMVKFIDYKNKNIKYYKIKSFDAKMDAQEVEEKTTETIKALECEYEISYMDTKETKEIAQDYISELRIALSFVSKNILRKSEIRLNLNLGAFYDEEEKYVERKTTITFNIFKKYKDELDGFYIYKGIKIPVYNYCHKQKEKIKIELQ